MTLKHNIEMLLVYNLGITVSIRKYLTRTHILISSTRFGKCKCDNYLWNSLMENKTTYIDF
jgi:hypothetical protein